MPKRTFGRAFDGFSPVSFRLAQERARFEKYTLK